MGKIYRKLDDNTLEQVNVIKREDLLEQLKVIEEQISEQIEKANNEIKSKYTQEINRITNLLKEFD